MTMLPICSATTSCSSHSQIISQGWLQSFSYRRPVEVGCILQERVALSSCSINHLQGDSSKIEVPTSLYSNFLDGREQTGSFGTDNINYEFSKTWNHTTGGKSLMHYVESGNLNIVSSGEQQERITENANTFLDSADPQTVIINDLIQDNPTSASDLLNIDSASSSTAKTNIGDVFSGINKSMSASVDKGQSVLNDSIEIMNSSVTSAFADASKAVDNAISQVFSSIDQIKESANSKLVGLSIELNKASSNVGATSVDLLRRAIVQSEDSLSQGASYVVNVYGSAKELLPPDVQNVVYFSEEWVGKISRPFGTAVGQIYFAISELEKVVGVDSNDPVIHLVLLVGISTTLWVSYLSITYGGYAGDLSPQSTLELLRGKENVVLIDVRPEVLRERDGIPDLRRIARFRYANVTLPEVDTSVGKLLRSGKDLDDTLVAAIVRNLKIIQDRSKVIIMDVDGSRSKGIARSLRKLGIQRPYLVQGGFKSWIDEGLRRKELKPETTLTILNEEAEAILEEINPTPLGVVGYGVALVAALYALSEWEKSLQLIGIVGLTQSIYRRVASYEGAEDFKQDVRLLLTPVKAGGQAISWAAGKLETNGIGLPTTPSSSDVQNRVLQAAAKHESQPSDEIEEELSPNLTVSANESADLSEA